MAYGAELDLPNLPPVLSPYLEPPLPLLPPHHYPHLASLSLILSPHLYYLLFIYIYINQIPG